MQVYFLSGTQAAFEPSENSCKQTHETTQRNKRNNKIRKHANSKILAVWCYFITLWELNWLISNMETLYGASKTIFSVLKNLYKVSGFKNLHRHTNNRSRPRSHIEEVSEIRKGIEWNCTQKVCVWDKERERKRENWMSDWIEHTMLAHFQQ